MNVTPVIARELQIRCRAPFTYWGRAGLGAIALMAASQALIIPTSAANLTAIGSATFRVVALLGFLLACGAAMATADGLSSERREGTLGLLLLTPLKPIEVIIGKLVVSSLTASYALFGFLPALGLIIFTGGVSGLQFVRVSIALVSTACLALGVGTWISARSEKRGKAMRAAVLMMIAFIVIPRFLGHAYRFDFAACPSPLTAYEYAFDSTYLTHWSVFWYSIACVLIETVLLIALAGNYLARTWQRASWSVKPPPEEWRPVDVEQAATLDAATKELLATDPVCWTVSRQRINGALWLGSILILLAGSGFSWLTLMSNARLMTFGMFNSLYLLVSIASGALLAWAAGRFLYEAQRSGELELLMTTPIGAENVISGNWRALCRPLRGAWLLVAFLVVISIISGGTAYVAIAVLLRVLDIIALCWVGMYFGLVARKSISIVAWTVALVIGIPWLLLLLFELFATQSGAGARASMLWIPLIAAKDLFFITWASAKLKTQLRTRAVAWRPEDWMAG
jgi:hypothetical protein